MSQPTSRDILWPSPDDDTSPGFQSCTLCPFRLITLGDSQLGSPVVHHTVAAPSASAIQTIQSGL